MDTALPQKFPFILDRNLAKAKCTENRVCTSCDTVVLGIYSWYMRWPHRGAYLRSACPGAGCRTAGTRSGRRRWARRRSACGTCGGCGCPVPVKKRSTSTQYGQHLHTVNTIEYSQQTRKLIIYIAIFVMEDH